MNPSQKPNLQNLSLPDRLLILLYIERLHLRARLRRLRPVHLLIPAALLQMAWFAVVMLHSAPPALHNLVIGNLLIVAAAILPSALPRSIAIQKAKGE
jgi:hypothetical protein